MHIDTAPRISGRRLPNAVRKLTAKALLPVAAELAGLDASTNKPSLRSLCVEGILSFDRPQSFVFGDLNILVGPNGSGKTNLIECVRLLRNSWIDIQETFSGAGFEDWLFRGRPADTGTASVSATVRAAGIPVEIHHTVRLGPAFNSRARIEEEIYSQEAESQEKVQYFVGSYRGTATLTVPGRRRGIRANRTINASDYDPNQSVLSQVRDVDQFREVSRLAFFYSGIRIYSEWTFGRQSNLRESTSAGRSDTMLSESMDDLPLVLNALLGTESHERIRKLLHEIKETYQDYLTRQLFGRIGLELLESPYRSALSAKRLSDGTLRFLAIASILVNSDLPSVICLEEPELGMHPDMIRTVAEMIIDASKRTQLIVSTHSEYLLSCLEDDFDVVFAFDASVGGSAVRPFSRAQFQSWRGDHSLGDLWTSGELGGNRW